MSDETGTWMPWSRFKQERKETELVAAHTRIQELEAALREACEVAERWIPNAGVARIEWQTARDRIATLRKLLP